MKTVNSISGGKTSAYLAKHYPADIELFSLVRIEIYNPLVYSLLSYIHFVMPCM